jgi:hypothetical protein
MISSCQPVTRQEKLLWFLTNTIRKPKGAWSTFVKHMFFKEMDQTWCIVMLQPLGMNQAQKKKKGLWGSKLALLITLK